MSWTQVDFGLVRYSPIENTHFFYDASHPSSIQFLLSGRWESWDVGYVGYKSRDPEIRRICLEAEARLVNDPQSGYRQWPSEPQVGSPAAPTNGQTDPEPARHDHAQTPAIGLPSDLVLSPSPDYEQPVQLSAPATPREPGPSTPGPQYTSPYGRATTTPYSDRTSTANTAPVQTAYPQDPHPEAAAGQQPPYPTQRPPLLTAPKSKVALSRRRETKILLSIDGDGVRGLSALLLIESLVNAICVRIGQRLDAHQIFDLTGGSSLGGVIAILLCRLQMQAHRAREAYKRVSKQVYLNKRDFYISTDPHVPVPNRDGSALENVIGQVIQEELGSQTERLFDDREDSGDVFVVSTHIEIGINKPALMRSYQTRRITGPELDANMTIAAAMKATSIAPRYIQAGPNSRLVIEPGLVDHGTAKNNPVRDILYECRKLFRYTNDMMIIVSIGTGAGLDHENEITEMANGVEDRKAEARMHSEKFEAENTALMERGWMKYFRFDVPGLDDVPLAEWGCEDVVMEKTSRYLALPEVGGRFYACVEAITKLLLVPGQ